MALVLADRVLETTPVAGTGDANLNGAVTGYQPFSVIGGGNTTYYTIVAIDDNGVPTGDWEVGIGTYVTTGNKLQRDTVLSSSNGGALVYFPSGNKQIFLDLPSEEVLLSAGDVNGPASAVSSNFALFDGTTGKLLKDAGINASTFATAAQGAKADTAVQPGSLGTAAYLNAGAANGVATLDSGGKVPTSQIPQMGDLNYQGTWNASTNTPTLVSSSGTKGYYYVVSVAGNTNLNGITDWAVGDWAVYNGSVWQKIDNTDAVTSVNGYTGTVVLSYSDVGAFPATSTTGSGNVVLQTGATLNNPTIGNYEAWTSSSAPSYVEGLQWYDSTAHSLAYYNDSANAVVHIGQDIQVKVINNTGSTIPNGSPVYITSTSSGQTYPNIALAKADVAATSAVIGLTNGEIANGSIGYVTSQGIIDNVNTGAFTVGQMLYLSPYSAGQLMNTIPPTGITVQVGVVSYVNSSTGKIYVKQTTPLAVPASIITGTLGVDHGGTGATTLTGYVKGSGTSALTASSTIPTTDLSGTITNAQLANSSITINGSSISLGGSATITANTTNALTIGTGLSGTSFNGSAAVTIANTGVLSFSAGTTGFTPSTTTTGAITLGGLLSLGSGGTNANLTAVAGGILYSGASALAISAAGTTGQFLQSTGAGTPVWATPVSYATVTDDTTTASTRYPLFANQTSGSLSTEYTSSTKLQYNPSTGVFTSTGFAGAGTGLTGTAASLSIGGNAATATSATTATNLAGGANGSVPYQTGSGATTMLAAGTNGNVLTLSGGVPTWATPSASLTITDDTTTNATRYLTFTSATSGAVASENVSSTKLQYNPSTGFLSSTILNATSKFQGDFSNATVNSRTLFQTSTINASTGIYAVPNGTSTAASWQATNAADPTNASKILIATNGSTDVQLVSGINGTGTYLPLSFYTNGAEKMRLDTSGNLLVGTFSASTPSTTGYISVANTFGFKNRIINGAMMIDQRNNGASQTITAGTTPYTADRWIGYFGGGNGTSQRIGTPGAYSLQFTGGAGVSGWQCIQRIEANNIADCANQNVTLSFTVSSTTQTSVGLFYSTPTAQDNFSSLNSTGTITGSAPVTSTPTRLSYTFAMPSTATNGFQFFFQLGAFTSGTFTITNIQLEKGSVATSFDYRPYGTELALCQRYFQGSIYSGGNSNATGYCGSAATSTNANYAYTLPVVMRATPTVSFNNLVWDDGIGARVSLGSSITNYVFMTNQVAYFYFTGSSGLTVGRPLSISITSSGGYLFLSAEL